MTTTVGASAAAPARAIAQRTAATTEIGTATGTGIATMTKAGAAQVMTAVSGAAMMSASGIPMTVEAEVEAEEMTGIETVATETGTGTAGIVIGNAALQKGTATCPLPLHEPEGVITTDRTKHPYRLHPYKQHSPRRLPKSTTRSLQTAQRRARRTRAVRERFRIPNLLIWLQQWKRR